MAFIGKSSWQEIEIEGIIRTLAVNYSPILIDWNDDGKCVVETASDGMVIGAVQAFCAFSLLVSQQNHSDLFLQAQANPLKQF